MSGQANPMKIGPLVHNQVALDHDFVFSMEVGAVAIDYRTYDIEFFIVILFGKNIVSTTFHPYRSFSPPPPTAVFQRIHGVHSSSGDRY